MDSKLNSFKGQGLKKVVMKKTGKLLNSINCTTITLVPKVRKPSVKEYGPFFLHSNDLYKVLTTRLKTVVDFISNRDRKKKKGKKDRPEEMGQLSRFSNHLTLRKTESEVKFFSPAEAEVKEWKRFIFRLLEVESYEWAIKESEAGTF